MNQLSTGLKKLQLLQEDGSDFGKTFHGVLENPNPGTKICSQTTTTALITTPINGQTTAKGSYLNRKRFIGNMSYRVKPAQLKQFLTKFGEVKNVHIVNDHITHLSKGIGFATFANAEMASKAKMAKPEELELDGRKIRINSAEERRVHKMRSKKRLQNAPLDLLDKDELPDSSSINILNDDALWLILSYLDKIELLEAENVCKRWKAVAHSIWASCRTLKFSKLFSRYMNGPFLDDNMLEKFLLRCTNLRTLDFENIEHSLTYRTSEIISELCGVLETLKVEYVGITNRGMELISEKCRNLKVVRLRGCHSVGEKGLWYLMKNCQNLECFEIIDHSKITGQCLENVSPNLKTLVISSCSQFWAFHRISSKCKNLRTLTLNSTSHSLTNKQLEDLFKNCLSIEHFELKKYCSRISSQGLLHLVNLSHLKYLNLYEQFTAVTDEVLIAVSKNCKALCTLDVSKCFELTDKGVKSLKLLPKLQNLTLNFIPALTSDSLKAIATRGQLVTLSMISCRIEDISGEPYWKNPPRWCDLEHTTCGPVQVLTLCPNMRTLNMANNEAITTQMITQCVNAIQRREETQKLTIGCGGCKVEKGLLLPSLPSYVDINWYSYSEAYYSHSISDTDDDDYFDDESDDSYEEEFGYGLYELEFPEMVDDDLYEPDFEDLDVI